jgi:serine phosphatase RsbU (regulator of sigma subunit)
LEGVRAAVNRDFLVAKVNHHGYAVLEDVELLVRALLNAGAPDLVQRSVDLVEGLRDVVGGDLIDEARLAIQSQGASSTDGHHRITPWVPSIAGVQIFVGMLPKAAVGADFFEVLPRGDHLLLALGDAPGTGLRGAFVARFVGNLFCQTVHQSECRDLAEVFKTMDDVLSSHPMFEAVSLICVYLHPRLGIFRVASAGHPYPVLFSARDRKCRRIPVRGDLLHSPLCTNPNEVRHVQRTLEIGRGDVLVLVTDGLTESHKFGTSVYGYRFAQIIEDNAESSARDIGEAVLDGWLRHSGNDEYMDDVTVMVAKMTETK